MEDKYCRELRANYETNGQVLFYDSVYAPIIQTIRAAVIALVVLLASDQVSALGISVGAVASFMDSSSRMSSGLVWSLPAVSISTSWAPSFSARSSTS